jgi:hypothetical protein
MQAVSVNAFKNDTSKSAETDGLATAVADDFVIEDIKPRRIGSPDNNPDSFIICL